MIHRITHASSLGVTFRACRRLVRIAGVSLLVCAAASGQTTWHVDDDATGDPGPGNPAISDPSEDGSAAHPFDAVQEAISAASAGDTVLIHDGTYTGAGAFALETAGKAILIRSENGPAKCVFLIPAGDVFASLDDGETTDTVFEGLQLSGVGAADARGIVISASSVSVRGCEIHDLAGGVIADGAGSIILIDSRFHHCHRGQAGGAAALAAKSVDIRGCEFVDNQARALLAVCDELTVRDSLFLRNSASGNGGAILHSGAVARISGCDFVENVVTSALGGDGGKGGAIAGLGPVLLVANCRFFSNEAKAGHPAHPAFGGAILAGQGLVQNCLFAGNKAGDIYAPGYGSAISGAGAELYNCTFSDNGAPDLEQHAVWVIGAVARNCIVRDRLFIPGGNIAYSNVLGGAGGPGNINTDPLFVDADGPDDDPLTVLDNDYRLNHRSPCIDAGDNSAVPADLFDLDGDMDTTEPTPLDLHGQARFVDFCGPDTGAGTPPLVDMGAIEHPPITTGDCNQNGAEDECDLANGVSADCNRNSIPDDCELSGNDCNANGVPDDCEPDCNANGVQDECDIAGVGSLDCNQNAVPDECEPDCNGNNIADECDIASGASLDCNTDGVPDECQPDCNGNGVQDDCDIVSGASADCDLNHRPDECDIADGAPDCNNNGVPDDCERATGAATDCNHNNALDECDIAAGTSADCDADGLPDECAKPGPLPGAALAFVSGRVEVQPSPDLSFGAGESITLEAWIHPNSVDGTRCILTKNTVGAQNYYLYLVGGRVSFGYRGADGTQAYAFTAGGSHALSPNTWRHVAVTHVFASGDVQIYLDGSPATGTWNQLPAQGPYSAADKLRIGSAATQAGQNGLEFDGWIDEVRIWRTLRSPAEIAATMNETLTGGEPGLQAYWPFNEGAGPSTADLAGDADGEKIGAVQWILIRHCPCPSDLDGDGQTGLADLARCLGAYGETAAGDVDGDGDSDLDDLSTLLGAFGQVCE